MKKYNTSSHTLRGLKHRRNVDTHDYRIVMKAKRSEIVALNRSTRYMRDKSCSHTQYTESYSIYLDDTQNPETLYCRHILSTLCDTHMKGATQHISSYIQNEIIPNNIYNVSLFAITGNKRYIQHIHSTQTLFQSTHNDTITMRNIVNNFHANAHYVYGIRVHIQYEGNICCVYRMIIYNRTLAEHMFHIDDHFLKGGILHISTVHNQNLEHQNECHMHIRQYIANNTHTDILAHRMAIYSSPVIIAVAIGIAHILLVSNYKFARIVRRRVCELYNLVSSPFRIIYNMCTGYRS